ncbi:putative ribose-5-phosphate isomerase 3 [Cardamine amara subsp. amara]|uniref:ribose-5-phosphate isomerase n=1 Tax=Cardamine amara subsp. amara TaxID=228776 RepID=A0ABD1ANK6_CARAN
MDHRGVPLVALDMHPIIDLHVDGAGEVDPNSDLVKGHGGALRHEKMVENVAEKFIVVANDTKLFTRIRWKWFSNAC